MSFNGRFKGALLMQNHHQNREEKSFKGYWGPSWLRFFMAFSIGVLLIDTGLNLLDIRIEWFMGISTFTFAWVMAMFLVPFVAGMAVGGIYGFGGKYLAHFPPVAVLAWDYYESMMHFPLPEGIHLLPWPLWAFFLILHMEFCAFGGVIGEILYHRHAGWDNRIKYRADSDYQSDETNALGR